MVVSALVVVVTIIVWEPEVSPPPGYFRQQSKRDRPRKGGGEVWPPCGRRWGCEPPPSARHGQSCLWTHCSTEEPSAWAVQTVSLQSLLLGSRLRGNQKLKLLGEVEFCPGKTTAPLPNCSADPHWHELGFVRFKCGRNLKAVMQIACLVPPGARESGRWPPVLQALRFGPPRLTSCACLRLSRLTDKTPSVSSLQSGPQATRGIAEGRGQRSGAGLELWFFGQWCGTGS